MSQVTVLAEGQITPSNAVVVELVEADETPAAVIIRWPAKPTVLHPRRFLTPRLSSRACSPKPTRRSPQSKQAGGCEPASVAQVR